MSITYPLSLPSAKAACKVTFRDSAVVGMSESPFTLSQQVYDWQASRWEADVELPPMKRADAEQWVAFLLSLNGRSGTFLLNDPANKAPRGAAAGTPLVVGGSQTGNSLNTDGWTPFTTLKAGDWFQLGTGATARLYKNLQDCTADSGTVMLLTIWPRLRSSPADNDALTLASPKCLMRLADNVRQWSIGEAQVYGLRFSAIEAL